MEVPIMANVAAQCYSGLEIFFIGQLLPLDDAKTFSDLSN